MRLESKLKMEKWSLKKVSEKISFQVRCRIGRWGVEVGREVGGVGEMS